MSQTPPNPATGGADSGVLPWTDPAALTRLARSDYREGFALLSNHFESQSNRFFCGPTSSTIVLNALRLNSRINLPKDSSNFDQAGMVYLPQGCDPIFERYTQHTFFNSRTDQVKTKAEVNGAPLRTDGRQDFGLSLSVLTKMLEAHGLAVKMHRALDEIPEASLLDDLKAALKTPGTFVLGNYHRSVLSQPGGGHISPIASYDQVSDSFLVLDVNPNKAPWVWVSSGLLIRAMRLQAGTTRGYVVLREGGS